MLLLGFSDNFFSIKIYWRMIGLTFLAEKMTCTACFKGSRLNSIFHRKARSFIFLKSLFKFFAEIFSLKTRVNKEVSSAKV